MFTVIITRHDPPFPLARWRASNYLTEIRTDDLKFTNKEAEKFFYDTMSLKLTTYQIASLKSRTEGWATGLQLAALSIRGQEEKSVNEYINRFNGSHKYVTDYFFEEVVRTQEDDIKQFLHRTSVVNRLYAPLCNELADRTDSQSILQSLDEADLFLIPLDSERRWYRYHHLFAEYLRMELAPEEMCRLHRLAGRWMESNGYIREAIGHALAAKDTENAIRLISGQLDVCVFNGELYSLIHWLDSLSDSIVCTDARFCSYKACAHFMIAEIEKANYYINAYKTFTETDCLNSGRIKSVESWLADLRDSKETISLASDALELIGDKDPCMRTVTLSALGHAQRNVGKLDESTKTLQEALSICLEFGYNMPFCSISMDLVYNYYFKGNLQKAIMFCVNTLNGKNTLNTKSLPDIGIINIPLGYFYLETNELALAEECIVKGIETAGNIEINKMISTNTKIVLAKIRFLQGKIDEAIRIIHQSINELRTAGLPVEVLRLHAVLADIMLKTNNIAWVENWIRESGLSLDDEVDSVKELPYLVYVRLLIAQERWEDARILLHKMEVFSRRGQRMGRLIIILVLKSLILSSESLMEDATAALAEAVELAADQNYRRSFLNEGEKLIDLLPLVKDRAPDFVNNLIEDYRAEVGLSSQIKKKFLNSDMMENGALFYERLSERETEVIKLVSSGLTNRHIAERLYISTGTVKWHINKIFSKLNVKNRTQAIIRARELKIIGPSNHF